MAVFKPFKGFRPDSENAEKIASPPYDVINSDEAREMAKNNPFSFLHIIKAEIDLPEDVDLHSDIVHQTAKKNLQQWIETGILKQDVSPCFYVYAQTMNGKTQYGLAGCTGVKDYMNNIIKKHELTRPDKEEDRMKLIRTTDFNTEPVFFAYKDHSRIDAIVNEAIKKSPEYDFVADDGIGHSLWIIDDQETVSEIEQIFDNKIPYIYVADGHHRTAAAALVGNEKKQNNPGHTGDEEYNFFLSVVFPSSQLAIIDYNRVIKDLNGLSETKFIEKLEEKFTIEKKGKDIYKPVSLHNFALYLSGKWYSLTAKKGTYNDADPIGVLDVTILTDSVLKPIIDIQDLRTSKRIDFVGGIRGLGELKKRVDSGEMKAAFALYPVTLEQLMKIADTNNIMPPKTTWFEPKLRSGLVLHGLS